MKPDLPMTPKRQLVRRLASLSAKMKRLYRMPVGDLSGSQIVLIPIIYSFDEPPTLNQLAEANESSYQNTRQILDKLEATGYVIIIPDTNDSRAIRSVLTEKGLEAVDHYYRSLSESVVQLYDGIEEDDIETTLEVLDKLYDRLDTLVIEPFTSTTP